MTSFRLHDPIWILLVLPIVGALVFAARRRRNVAILFSTLDGMRALPITWAQRAKGLIPGMRLLGLALIALGLARPQQGREEFRVRTEGIAIMLAVDRSGSMQALDFQDNGRRIDRISLSKQVIGKFVDGRPNDLIGLVTFGGFAESRCPLTLDHGALLQVVDSVEVPKPLRDASGRIINQKLVEEESETAIGDALALGADRMKNVTARSKVMILLSDGESNAGVIEPEDGAKAAALLGIKIYTIGIGTTGTVPFPGRDVFGRPSLVPMDVRMDEATMKKIADITGGQYFNAQDTETLKEIYATIDRLERTSTEGRLYTDYRELYPLALLPGVALLLLEMTLGATRLRTLP